MVVSTYTEALNYLYANLPVFQRVGASAYKADLKNTELLCEALDNPHHKFKTIHVAGTNGKGSTSHMLASVLQTAGYKTGLYTSPHLKEFTERIRINGEEISPEFVVTFVNKISPLIEEIKPSFFEITVAMAFDYYATQHVDIAVIEVGLGGRLDSTNVITPLVSVITNIGWDHKDILGDTLDKIAFEKAGIIKTEIPVIVSERQENVRLVFEDKARSMRAPLYFGSDIYQVISAIDNELDVEKIEKDGVLFSGDFNFPLGGLYQKKNIPGVLAAIDVLNTQGFVISKRDTIKGLEDTNKLTHFKGRWQKLGEHPLVICDTGHNLDGVREIIHQIRLQTFDHLHMVWGAVKDKDITDILRLLPKNASYYFCQAKIPRALDAYELERMARIEGLSGQVVTDVNAALHTAKANAKPNDMIFVGGSTFVVAEVNEL
jgi:dihydrofolate synthase/folylpolyglutamate synthase